VLSLTRLLEVEMAKMPARASVYVKHLGTGEEAAVAADEPFNSYSVIKIPIMMMAFELADQKKLDLAERHIMAPADFQRQHRHRSHAGEGGRCGQAERVAEREGIPQHEDGELDLRVLPSSV
jgi:hypothetical protein